MNRIGCDPGLSGALALLNGKLQAVELYDMPVMAGTGKRQQVNAVELAKIIERWRKMGDVTAFVERVSPMPKEGVSSVFSFGRSYGMVEMALAYARIPMVLVTPQSWKKKAKLIGKEKDACRTLIQQLYPYASLSRKKDIGRADAIAIARFSGGED